MFSFGHILSDVEITLSTYPLCFFAFVILFLFLLLDYKVLDGEGLWLGFCSARQYEEIDIDDPSTPQKKVD